MAADPDLPLPIKQRLKRYVPARLLRLRHEYRSGRHNGPFQNLSTREVFTKIYEDGVWGRSTDPQQRYFSGTGSHDRAIVDTYVAAVGRFLGQLTGKPDVVDLGCGDFSVGSRLRPLCARYTACDIVEPVIEFNRRRFEQLQVDFRTLDFTREALPAGDVVFIRQVLQHLSNDEIMAALPRIAGQYRYLVLTEHLPAGDDFVPNQDKPAGFDIRLGFNSGLVLTRPPFNLVPLEQRVLCQAPEDHGIIRTILYRLRP
ncbi:MAG: class I SAM-dependent methyltransferase [Burkholderiaceae bacterium]